MLLGTGMANIVWGSTKTQLMKNFVVRYGIIGGCLSIGLGVFNWFFIAKAFGNPASQVVGYLSIVVALLCVPLGIKYFRDKLNDGMVSFAQGFKIGIGITAINAIMTFFYGMLFFVFVRDDFRQWQESEMTAGELARFQAQMAQLPEFVSGPWFQGLILFLTICLIGSIINLISSLLLKRA